MLEVVELYVVMHCEACAASVKRAIKKIPGVESYKIDFYEQKVTVTGDVNRQDVWRRIHKTGKRATLIPKPDPPKEEKKKEEKKVEDTVIQVEEKKQEETKVIEEVKVHETKEEVVTVVDTKAEAKEEIKEGAKEETKKEEKKKEEPVMRRQLEWVPMFVTAPYYTLPSTFY